MAEAAAGQEHGHVAVVVARSVAQVAGQQHRRVVEQCCAVVLGPPQVAEEVAPGVQDGAFHQGELRQPEKENAFKFEMFIFDTLPLAERWTVVETSRREEFAPLKNATGPDSPDTVKRALVELAADWLERAGVTVPRTAGGTPAESLEISPLFALEAGDLVPADARLIESVSLAAIEKSLTGESEPAEKDARAVSPPPPADTPLAERSGMVYSGTAIATGTARAVVIATGMRTEMGRIAALIATAEADGPTPLQSRLAPGGEPVVMHVSNFRPVKRVDAVLDVFIRITRRVPARLVLVGDGPDRPSLEARVNEEGLSSRVLFAGEQQDLVSWLSSADLFLLPSAQESFGLAALEAMACEIPVIASRVGGLPEVIEDGETGFLRDPDDLDGMAANAVALLEDPALGRRIGVAAAQAVQTRFCTDVIVPLYEEYYREVLRSPTQAG